MTIKIQFPQDRATINVPSAHPDKAPQFVVYGTRIPKTEELSAALVQSDTSLQFGLKVHDDQRHWAFRFCGIPFGKHRLYVWEGDSGITRGIRILSSSFRLKRVKPKHAAAQLLIGGLQIESPLNGVPNPWGFANDPVFASGVSNAPMLNLALGVTFLQDSAGVKVPATVIHQPRDNPDGGWLIQFVAPPNLTNRFTVRVTDINGGNDQQSNLTIGGCMNPMMAPALAKENKRRGNGKK